MKNWYQSTLIIRLDWSSPLCKMVTSALKGLEHVAFSEFNVVLNVCFLVPCLDICPCSCCKWSYCNARNISVKIWQWNIILSYRTFSSSHHTLLEKSVILSTHNKQVADLLLPLKRLVVWLCWIWRILNQSKSHNHTMSAVDYSVYYECKLRYCEMVA